MEINATNTNINGLRDDLNKIRVDVLKMKELYIVDKSRYDDAIIHINKSICDLYSLQRKLNKLSETVYYIKIVVALHIIWNLINVIL